MSTFLAAAVSQVDALTFLKKLASGQSKISLADLCRLMGRARAVAVDGNQPTTRFSVSTEAASAPRVMIAYEADDGLAFNIEWDDDIDLLDITVGRNSLIRIIDLQDHSTTVLELLVPMRLS